MATTGGGLAHSERLSLCELFEQKGPLAPTLCVGWATADLAAHLYVREAKPWKALGAVIRPLSHVTEKSMEDVKRSLGFDGLVSRLRAGPPGLGRPFDDQLNTVEFFVHHEDVRRAGGSEQEPRENDALDDALYRNLRLLGRLLTRRLREVTLELRAPGRVPITLGRNGPTATLSGPPQELTLYLYGRSDAARVELGGADEARERVATAHFGL